MTYRVPLELVTRVNGAYNDGCTTLTNSTYHVRIVENTRSYEVRNGGSIPSRDAKQTPLCKLSVSTYTNLTKEIDMKRSAKR